MLITAAVGISKRSHFLRVNSQDFFFTVSGKAIRKLQKFTSLCFISRHVNSHTSFLAQIGKRPQKVLVKVILLLLFSFFTLEIGLTIVCAFM